MINSQLRGYTDGQIDRFKKKLILFPLLFLENGKFSMKLSFDTKKVLERDILLENFEISSEIGKLQLVTENMQRLPLIVLQVTGLIC